MVTESNQLSRDPVGSSDTVFLSGGGELGALMRAHDWARSPLGHPAGWPQSLRSVVGLMLNSKFPMFVAWGPDLAFLYNDGCRPIFGAKHPRALGLPFREVWSEIWADIEPLVATAMAGEATFHENLHLVMERNGFPEDTWYTFSYSPIRDESGSVAGMFCACQETTEQVRSDAALRDGEERLRIVQAAGGIGSFDYDLRKDEAVCSPEYYQLFGLPQGAPINRETWPAQIHPDDRKRALEALDRAIAERRPYDYEYRIIRADNGEVRWLSGRAAVVFDEQDRPWRYVGGNIDITVRRRAEERLRESEERLRLIVDGARDYAILTTDPERRVTSWSKGAEAAFGISADDMIGRSADEIFTPEDRAAGQPEREVETARETGCANDERWHVRADGSRVFMNGSVHPLPRDETGRERGFIKIARDETRQRMQAEALAATRAELVESEARFREQFENANDFIFTADLEMRITSCNPAAAAAVGRTPEDLIGHSIAEFVPPEVLTKNQAMLAAKVEGREATTRYEAEVFGPDGARMCWEINSRLTRDENGAPTGLHAIGRDITERQQAERELRESEARLRALTDHLPGGMVYQIATGKDGSERRFLYVSRSHERLTRIPAEAVLADPSIPYGLILPEDRGLVAEAEAAAIRDRKPFDVQVRFRREDGEVRWCRIISAPREQPDGSLIWDGIQIDITEQKRTEDELRVRGEEFYALADNIPSLCWIAYADGHIFWYNRRWYEYTGTTAREMEGWGWESVHDPDLLPIVAERWRQSLATGEPFEMTFPLKGADGAFRPFLTRIVPIRDSSGDIVRWFGTNVDITDRVEAERLLEQRVEERTADLLQAQEALRQSQKLEAMGQLTGGVAHDFNNLLTPIIGSLDLLQRKGIGGEREQRLIGGALQSAERAKTLVQRLLAFARRQPLQPHAVDVAALVTGMAELVASTSGPQVKVRVDLPADLPPALADPNQLEMAVLNLSVNARDAMPDGGTLTISAAPEAVDQGHRSRLSSGRYVRISVADTGVGMDEETLAHAIEPFFSTKGIGKGTGLGLSMVHGLASQLGGALQISSRRGLGTNVELWLPESEHAVGAAEAKGEAAPNGTGAGTALLVDDEELVRMSTADMLSELGYSVVEAASGEEALRLIEGGLSPDVLVTDHLMPGMTGADLARAARERRSDLPVLIVSGYAESEGIAPDMPRLTKPFRQGDLAAAILDLRPVDA